MKTTQRHFQTALVASLLLAVIVLPSRAADVRGLARLGADFGGDTLVVGPFTTGTSAKIKANEGVYLGGGMSILNDAKKLSLDLAATWKYTSIEAVNQTFEFTRFPLEVLGFYHFSDAEGVRIGGGLSYQLNPKFKADGNLRNGTANFDNAAGYVIKIDYTRKHLNFGARYTAAKYEISGAQAATGNGPGLFVGGVF